ncbi:hypothetical protein ACHAW5_001247 [Stephanodiscus triporus]|uniref:tRNA dimethylallyltransferase n=1 Tax=Stephanodiscus triporus TaxID=2934178 RepID=A0ABD3N1L3_9STRA
MEEDEYEEDIDEDEHEDGGGTKGEDDVVDLAEEEEDDEAGRRRGRVVGRRDRAVVARGHVVSADSVQVYRGADVGSNKPTRIELGITPHHLIDVVDLLESSPSSPSPAPSSSSSYNAADWMDDARYWLVRGMPDAVRPTECAARRAAGAIDAFRSRRRVDDDGRGSEDGTAAGISAGSGGDDDAAATTAAEAEAEDVASWEVASAHVSSLGPLFARRVRKLPGRDWYRLRRLLEVAYTISSSKIGHSNDGDGERVRSEEEREREILRDLTEGEVYTGLRSGSLSDLGYDVRCFFLCQSDRMTHFHVVDERCERMLMSGLLRETADLCVSGALSDESQALQYLERADVRRNDVDAFAGFLDDFKSATRQYAKKQMQWFRRDNEFAFVPIRMDDDKDERVRNAAEIIADLCKMRREDFDAELNSSSTKNDDGTGDGGGGPPNTDIVQDRQPYNERQGKTMKFFISKRVHLVDGTDELTRVMAEADECTDLVQGFTRERC